MSDLPPGWAIANIPDMVTNDGLFCDGDWVESKDQDPHGDVRLIQLADIGDGSYRDRSARFLTSSKAQGLGCTFLQPGDVLIARMPDPLGRACLFPGDSKASVTVVDVCVVRPSFGSVSPRWLMHTMNAPQARRAMVPFEMGTTRKRISRRNLARIPLPVPPLAEQQRIVAAIEEQFSRLDAGIEALERVLSRVAQIAKAVVIAAIPNEMPSNWTLLPVGDAGHVQLGRQRSPRFHTGPNMHPYLRVANVFEDRIDTSDVMAMHFSESEFRQYELKSGDILLNEGQSPHLLGRPAMYRGNPPNVAFTNSLLRFQAKEGILPSWALLVFRRHLHARRFMKESQITTNIAHLSAGRFKTIEFPVPPIDEQRQIVDSVTERLSSVAFERSAAERSLVRASYLHSSILAAAFAGKLVPQDPNDEPASVLLRRVANQRASSNAYKSMRARKPQTTTSSVPI